MTTHTLTTTHALTPVLVILLAGLGFGVGRLAAPGQASADEPDLAAALQRLDERMTALEKAVLRDPFRPDTTVLARLQRLEQRLDDQQKGEKRDEQIDRRAWEEVKRSVEQQRKQGEELDRRVRTLELQRPDTPDLRRDLQQLERTTDDLKQRLSRLESRR